MKNLQGFLKRSLSINKRQKACQNCEEMLKGIKEKNQKEKNVFLRNNST